MNDLIDLLRKLDRIDQAGQLEELQCQLANDRRGMNDNDLYQCPEAIVQVDRLANVAHRMTGDPLDTCERAATEALLPTKRRQAIELVEHFYSLVVEAETTSGTADKLARERRTA